MCKGCGLWLKYGAKFVDYLCTILFYLYTKPSLSAGALETTVKMLNMLDVEADTDLQSAEFLQTILAWLCH